MQNLRKYTLSVLLGRGEIGQLLSSHTSYEELNQQDYVTCKICVGRIESLVCRIPELKYLSYDAMQ